VSWLTPVKAFRGPDDTKDLALQSLALVFFDTPYPTSKYQTNICERISSGDYLPFASIPNTNNTKKTSFSSNKVGVGLGTRPQPTYYFGKFKCFVSTQSAIVTEKRKNN